MVIYFLSLPSLPFSFLAAFDLFPKQHSLKSNHTNVTPFIYFSKTNRRLYDADEEEDNEVKMDTTSGQKRKSLEMQKSSGFV